MRITLTPPGGGQAFVLADDAAPRVLPAGLNFAAGLGGVILSGFLPTQTLLTQATPLFRAAHPFTAPRYNVTNSLRFTVSRGFVNTNACLLFLAGHADSVPVAGELCLTYQSSAGLFIRYLPNCLRQGVDCVRHIGASCDIIYSLSAAAAWQQNP